MTDTTTNPLAAQEKKSAQDAAAAQKRAQESAQRAQESAQRAQESAEKLAETKRRAAALVRSINSGNSSDNSSTTAKSGTDTSAALSPAEAAKLQQQNATLYAALDQNPPPLASNDPSVKDALQTQNPRTVRVALTGLAVSKGYTEDQIDRQFYGAGQAMLNQQDYSGMLAGLVNVAYTGNERKEGTQLTNKVLQSLQETKIA